MIEFRDVSKYYLTQHSRKVVVDHLTLRLPAGAKVGLLGRNGAGKSTMIGMIAGTVKPNTGSSAARAASPGRSGSAAASHPISPARRTSASWRASTASTPTR